MPAMLLILTQQLLIYTILRLFGLNENSQ